MSQSSNQNSNDALKRIVEKIPGAKLTPKIINEETGERDSWREYVLAHRVLPQGKNITVTPKQP